MFDLEKGCLSKYSIEKVIGNGSFGSVFLANDKSTNKKVALKICPSWSDGVTNYLYNEMLILSLIDSPYFPKFYHSDDHGSFFIIALEYCPGKTLLQYLEQNGCLKEQTILMIFKQMLDAISYLHHHKIVHRDIKLENIVIADDMNIKLCDFGFSTFVKQNQQLTDFCGSIQYCSPEMINQQAYDGESNDVWTLGVCVLKMCLGLKSFDEVSGGKPITGYYSIFNSYIESTSIKSVLKGIFIQEQEKRITLRNIYKILNLEEPMFNDIHIKFFDPIIIEKMKTMNYTTRNIYDTVQDGNEPEYYIYRLILNRLYLKQEHKASVWLQTKDILSVIADGLKYERSLFCCYQKTYYELIFNSEVSAETFFKPLPLDYTIYSLKPNRKIVQFPNKILIVEFTVKKSKGTAQVVRLVLVCGEVHDFCQTLVSIIAEYTKMLYSTDSKE
ncbi:CAMK/CAMKL protein kinase [Vittaforma corneae ATCC 50505]|uniref:CAMK/CAMKL protein kinase n=1 Tax=Vittaforma corneae (strain ATCC 50505) TaxID=993615 RepID=L2GKS6_VITCO|nr:CAMK/CAMKL protein kinase [Vittaforma corneae ATCC 50505]ELA40902.1 CAMK/CAMKL protein kinase [Vittaforma corneae ATCC 50505]